MFSPLGKQTRARIRRFSNVSISKGGKKEKKKEKERKKERKEKKSADYRPLSSNNRGLVAGQILFDIFLFLFFVLFFFIPHLVRVILSSSGPPGPRKVPRVPTSSNSRHQWSVQRYTMVYQDGTVAFLSFPFLLLSFFLLLLATLVSLISGEKISVASLRGEREGRTDVRGCEDAVASVSIWKLDRRSLSLSRRWRPAGDSVTLRPDSAITRRPVEFSFTRACRRKEEGRRSERLSLSLNKEVDVLIPWPDRDSAKAVLVSFSPQLTFSLGCTRWFHAARERERERERETEGDGYN